MAPSDPSRLVLLPGTVPGCVATVWCPGTRRWQLGGAILTDRPSHSTCPNAGRALARVDPRGPCPSLAPHSLLPCIPTPTVARTGALRPHSAPPHAPRAHQAITSSRRAHSTRPSLPSSHFTARHSVHTLHHRPPTRPTTEHPAPCTASPPMLAVRTSPMACA